VCEQVVELIRETYRAFGGHHQTELLSEKHGIRFSRSTVRRSRQDAELTGPWKRRVFGLSFGQFLR